MSTALDKKIVPLVPKILSKYGRDVSFQTFTSETANATTGTVTQAGESEIVVRSTPPYNYAHRLIDGEVIKDGDAAILIAAQGLTFTPYVGQRVTLEGAAWRVMDVRTHSSGQDIAAYELRLRRGPA